jgi:hypothetical protein
MFFLVLLFFYRRRKHHRNSGTRPMKPDLIGSSEDQPAPQEERGELPQLYEPEPFIIPDAFSDPETSPRHSLHSTHDGQQPRTSMTTASGMPGHGRAPSRLSVTTVSEVGGPGPTSSSGRSKSGMPPSAFRPVNFVQHEDAGDIPTADQEPETVELPPAYTALRNRAAGTSDDGPGAGPSGAATSTAPAAAPAEST